MSKTYYKCEECGNSFPEDKLVMTEKLELNCLECIEEAKKDKRIRNMTLLMCAIIAGALFWLIYKFV